MSNLALDAAQTHHLEKLKTRASALEQRLSEIRRDLIFFSQMPAFAHFVESSQNQLPASNHDEILQALNTMLLREYSYCKSAGIFDKTGKEFIGIEWQKDSMTEVPVTGLVSAVVRPYFTDALKSPDGSRVYVSTVELDTTKGKIHRPYSPLIRYAIPLQSSSGEVFGVLMMTLHLDSLLHDVDTPESDEIFYVVDSDGSYLLNPDSSHLYGTLLNTGITLGSQYPENARTMLSEKEGILYARKDRAEMLQAFTHVTLPDPSAIHWTVLSESDMTSVWADIRRGQAEIWAIAALGLALAFTFTLWATHRNIQPLRNRLVDDKTPTGSQENDFPIPKNDTREDEIGQLERIVAEQSSKIESMGNEISNYTQALASVSEKENEVLRVKKEFLSTISHEMRTPLNAILGFTELMMSKPPAELPEKYHWQLSRVHANGLRLLSLVEDLLDLHKMERGYLEIYEEPFSPTELVERLSARVSNQIEHSGLRYYVAVDKALPKVLIGDRLRIGQIVLNLLLNAFKFTKQGEVELNAKALPSSGSLTWAITVRDTGIGIPPQAQTLIFEPFRQLDGSLQREYGGTGLGLAISLQLCRQMGGDLTVQSAPGEGSTFTVCLPLKPYR